VTEVTTQGPVLVLITAVLWIARARWSSIIHPSARSSASDKNRDRIASDDADAGLRCGPLAHTGEIGLIASANK